MGEYKGDHKERIAFLKDKLRHGDNWVVFSNRQLYGPFEGFTTFQSARRAALHCQVINGGTQAQRSGKEIKCHFDAIADMIANFHAQENEVELARNKKLPITTAMQVHRILPYLNETTEMQENLLASGLIIPGKVPRMITPVDWVEEFQLVLHSFHPQKAFDTSTHRHKVVGIFTSQEDAVTELRKTPSSSALDSGTNRDELLLVSKYKGGDVRLNFDGRPTPDTGLLIGVYRFHENKLHELSQQLHEPVEFHQTVFLRFDPLKGKLSLLDDRLFPMDFNKTVQSVSADYLKSNFYKVAEFIEKKEKIHILRGPQPKSRKRKDNRPPGLHN